MSPPTATQDGVLNPGSAWLGVTVCSLFQRCIVDVPATQLVMTRAMDAIAQLARNHEDLGYDFDQILHNDVHVRRAFFWRFVERSSARHNPFPRDFWAVELPSIFNLRAKDAEWLAEDCVTRSHVRERILAFNCLLAVAPEPSGRDDAFWTRMEDVARRSDVKNEGGALARRLERERSRGVMPESPWNLRQNLRRRVAERAKERLRQQNQEALRQNLKELREGTFQGAYAHFLENFAKPGPKARYESLSCKAIAEEYGQEIADAAREGFKHFWRTHDPAAARNVAENEVPYTCICGLIGLALEVEDGTDLTSLPDYLLERAIRYAPWELNAFPRWLTTCAARVPSKVGAALAEDLRTDFGALPREDGHNFGRIVSKVEHGDTEVREACAPEVLKLLLEGDPPRLPVLQDALRVLQRTGVPVRSERVALAKARTDANCTDYPRFALWWSFLLADDPVIAVTTLEETARTAERPDELIEEACSSALKRYDERAQAGLDALRSDPTSLASLIRIVRAHVRPEQDLVHKRMYSPGRRDYAQRFRDALLGWLGSIDAPETAALLEGLIERPEIASEERDWIRHLAGFRRKAAVSKAMPLERAVTLLTSLVVQPSTPGELFTIAKNRLSDVQRDLTHGDFSVRQAYCPKKGHVTEEPVQNLLAGELQQRARGQYEVVREPELTRKARPDIRLVNPRCEGRVTIELKIAERWSVTQLETAVTEQLVGTYMRANKSGYGLFVVCSSGESKGWRTADGTALDFSALVSHLSYHAKQVRASAPWVADLAVVGLDFH